jgi:hypothetical protein
MPGWLPSSKTQQAIPGLAEIFQRERSLVKSDRRRISGSVRVGRGDGVNDNRMFEEVMRPVIQRLVASALRER